ncbi:Plug domain-containing protein, partial [Sphingomonas sp.]|uniref:Plug domain-containing protein n=1 Tax=Sphingomonas sp. TaxID=28214 RepID=UPI0025F3BB0D
MRKFKLLGTTMLTGAAMLAQPAFAQDATTTADTAAAAQDTGSAPAEAAQPAAADQGVDCATTPSDPSCKAIVVTGSRIRRPNLESPIPVTSIGGEEFFETGTVSVGDTLNDLPALRSTFSQANSTRFLGTAGINNVDLRGLGIVRTLVLQNGRRHVGGDVLNSGVTPDTNTIPTDLIDRVDIVTGGNSAVYGSDAIAGVVNFILKDDYEGIKVRAQGGISKYGDAGAYFISGLWGTNFAEGRGNIAINAEYARQDQYFGAGRWLGSQDGFLVVDADSGAVPSDGIPDRIFYHDIHSGSLTNTGAVRFGGQNAANSCGTDPLGSFYPCFFVFNKDGTLVPATGVRAGVTTGSFIGGNSENFRGGNQLQLSPKLDRYNINAFGHFEITPALVPFFEAKYSRTDSFGSGGSGPAFTQGATFGDPAQFFGLGNREQVRLDNPFLDPAARALICARRALQVPAQGCADGSRISIRENLLGLGVRNEEAKRETYRVVVGFRGTFWDDWNYEIAVNGGRLNEKTKVRGNLDIQRYLLAVDAVDQGKYNGGLNNGVPNGNIVCASQIDPNRAFGYYPWLYGTDQNGAGPNRPVLGDPNAAARLAADVAACTP